MLAVNVYSKAYVDDCRSQMESQLAAYKSLVTAARNNAGTGKSALTSAVAALEPLLLNNLILVLDRFFVHRTRALEKKDGNPLNEVRMLCNSILQNRGVLATDKTINYTAEKSILKLQIGDEIKLTEADFVRLFRAFFADIAVKFT